MKNYNQNIELIVKRPSTGNLKDSEQLSRNLKKAGIDNTLAEENKPVLSKKGTKGKSKSIEPSHLILTTNAKDTEVNPWDMAHLSVNALGKEAGYTEPNFIQEYTIDRKVDAPPSKLSAKSFGNGKSDDNYDPDWQPHSNLVWHLGDNFSQLKSARESVAHLDYKVRIGHIDTGYSKKHFVVPDAVKQNPLQRNFIDDEDPHDAHDRLIDGLIKQPGHGTGTLGLLAGGQVDIQTANGRFKDYLGGAPFAEVISCRIAKSVVLFKTSAFADALNYLTQLTLSGTQVHVVSMSMGGAPSRIWADAVNTAYDSGIILVTAAGNNFNGLPTRHVVFPARFGRVIAACGVTYDFKPYYSTVPGEMQGCFGPKKHMNKALSAFTPNTPWASVESGAIQFSGAGTSSATPQIAAAAAIYYRKYHRELDALEPWKRVEVVRNALYRSAIKKVGDNYNGDFATYFGNGIIQANEALKIPVLTNLKKTPEDTVPWFPILATIFKAKPNPQQNIKLDMFNTELSQLVYNYPELRGLIDESKSYEKISSRKWEQFREAVINHRATSVTLKKYLMSSTLTK